MFNEILELAHKISTERKADVIVNYGGHIKILSISVYYNGWTPGRNADCHCDIFNIKNDINDSQFKDMLNLLQAIYEGEPMAIEAGQCALCKCKLYTIDKIVRYAGNDICTQCVNKLKEI